MSEDFASAMRDSDAEALAIGRFIIVWRAIETMVTLTTLSLHKWSIGKEVEPRSAPRALKRKLALLEHCYENDPQLEDLRLVSNAIIVAARAFAAERDFLVHHTVVRPFEDIPALAINLDRVPWPDPPAHPDIRALADIPLAEMYDYALDVVPLFNRFLSDTLSIIRPNHLDKEAGESVSELP